MTSRPASGLLATAALLLATVALAQAPPAPPPSCDDHLRASQIQLQATTMSQLRERGDAARELAALQKRVEQLQAEVVTLRPKKEQPTPKEEKK